AHAAPVMPVHWFVADARSNLTMLVADDERKQYRPVQASRRHKGRHRLVDQQEAFRHSTLRELADRDVNGNADVQPVVYPHYSYGTAPAPYSNRCWLHDDYPSAPAQNRSGARNAITPRCNQNSPKDSRGHAYIAKHQQKV